MDDSENDYVLAFDHFYTNNHIQIMKVLMPYLSKTNLINNYFPVIIKYLELQQTISIIQKGMTPVSQISSASTDTTKGTDIKDMDIEKMYYLVKNYLSPQEDQSIKKIVNTVQMFKNMKEMQQMMELVQSMPKFDADTPSSKTASDEQTTLFSRDEQSSKDLFSEKSGNEQSEAPDISEILEMIKMFSSIKQ